jgi:ABC-type multidrug transport system fused ATPase/permease subunit
MVVMMKETISNLKRVYKYGKKYKKNLIIFTIISISNIAINIIYPIVTARQLVALSSSLYMELLIAALICFGMSFLCDFTTVALRKNTQVFFRGTTKDIQIDASREILKIELTSIDKEGSGTFIQRISNDTDEMSRIFTRGMGYLTGILTDIGIYVAIFIVNKIVFCYFLICSVLLTMLHLLKVRKMNEEDKKYRKQREKTNSLVGELVRGIRDIKMLYAKESFIEKIEENIDDLTNSQFALRNVEINYNCIIDGAYDLCEIILIFLFIYLMTNNYLTMASALVLYNYRSRVFSNLMKNVGSLLQEIKGFNLSCNRVFSILDNKEFNKEVFGTEHIEKIKGNFEFKNVHFGYGNNEVLKGMSFKVNTNETVAFVGKSGVGKTTIFSLLCKLYDINSGSILIDGKDIKTLDESSIRNNITIISQNPYIFNMSIKDNFKLVKKDITDQEIAKACKLACLDEFINNLPEGYNTIVGEGGVTLSGGQRQRLAIARAFIQNTKIILFDEATSALDNETQGYIQQAINNMKDKYTILIIAHRLSTVINSDRIMLVEDGKISDVGTHKELLSNNKMYKKLYENEILDQ